MRLSLRLLCSLPLVLAACRGQNAAEAPALSGPLVRPLANLVAQQVVVVPTHSLREGDQVGWSARVPRSRELLRSLDDEIASELGARGIRSQWIWPADLVRASRANPSYSVDPYVLAAGSLRSPNVVGGTRLGDPLATQLRTTVAMQDRARAVLIPVELRFDRDSSGKGVAVLRVVLLDGRLGEVRWIGDVRGEPSSTFSRELLIDVASKFADLITAR